MSTTVLDEIHDALSNLPQGVSRRYPATAKTMIANYGHARLKNGASLSKVCSEIGMGHQTLVSILRTKNVAMYPVRIVPSKSTIPKEPQKILVVKGPGGLVIEGLDVQDIATLFRALSC